jgi:hypothetical protein
LRIEILVEGATEKAFETPLRDFLKARVTEASMPRIRFFPCNGRIYKEGKLRRTVEDLLQKGKLPADAVIALTDVYTGSRDFADATEAKRKMREWVGNNERFYPHAAQYDFEAWLLPFWPDIQNLAGHTRSAPAGLPETINHGKPPSYHIQEVFRTGTRGRYYSKVRDAGRILKGKDLSVPAAQCPELRAFLNTILRLSGASLI